MVPSLETILHSLQEGYGFSCAVVAAVLGLHMVRPFVAVEVDASVADLAWIVAVVVEVGASCADLGLAAAAVVGIDASTAGRVVVAEEFGVRIAFAETSYVMIAVASAAVVAPVVAASGVVVVALAQ